MLGPVVIDNGTGTIKAGMAGSELPAVQFPTFVGRPRHAKAMSGGLEETFLVGDKAAEHRGVLKLNYPITHGLVGANSPDDWSDMQKIWEYTLAELKVENTKEQHPVLLTEAPNNPRANRIKAAEIFFETFNVPGLYVQIQAVLSLYASGRTTGVVLDSGDGVTCAVPIYEGFSLPHAIQRSDVAGRDVTDYLQLLLQRCGHNFHTSAEFEIVKDIKEKICYVAFNIEKSEADAWEDLEPEVPYPLPDGNVINIRSEKFKAPEVLFNPALIGEEYAGMHEVLYNAISSSYTDLRKDFFTNILLSGGSTCFQGLGERLLSELRKLCPRDTKIKIFAPRTRITSTWVGGSILASLGSFRDIVVTQKAWDEFGKRALFEKCW